MHTRRRTIAAATASTVVALAAWLTAPGAGAQTEGGFTNGTAKATALISRIAPGVGSLQLALGAGSSVAELRNGPMFAPFKASFPLVDANKDGGLDKVEMATAQAAMQRMGRSPTAGLDRGAAALTGGTN